MVLFKRDRLNPNLPLRWVLVSPFVLLTVSSVALVGYLSNRSSQQATEMLAHQLLQQTSERVRDRLDTYLHPAQLIVAANQLAVQQGILDLNDQEQLRRQFWQQALLNLSANNIGFWRESGEALGYARITSKEVQQLAEQASRQTLPPGTLLLQQNRPNQRQFFTVDAQGKAGKYVFQYNDDFRTVPWYREAKRLDKPGWTGVSFARIIPALQIGAVSPVFDRAGRLQGFFTATYFLSEISQFLHQLQFSPNGQVFIIERCGDLVATSVATEAAAKRQVNGKNMRLSALDSQDGQTRSVARQIIQKWGHFDRVSTPVQDSFTIAGQRLFVEITPYHDKHGLDWHIVTLIPESDFMAQIHRNTQMTVVLCLLTAVGAIAIGTLITTRVVHRITLLNQASAALAAGHLTQHVPTNSGIVELQGLARSFNQMAAQLRQSFDRVQTTLQESEEKFTTVFRASPDPISITTLEEGRFLHANSQITELLGYTAEEIIGHTAQELGLWPNLTERQWFRDQLQQEGTVRNLEVTTRTKANQLKTVLISASVCQIQGQAIVIVMLRDISDRKAAEQALQQSEAKTKDILDSAVAAIVSLRIFKDHAWCIDQVSAGCQPLSGYTPQEILSDQQLWVRRIHPDDWQAMSPGMFAAIVTERNQCCEYRFQHKEGYWIWISETKHSRWDEVQQCWVVTAFSVDISDRKRLELALQQSEAQTKDILDSAVAAITSLRVFADGNWHVDQMSAGCELLSGYTPEELTLDQHLWVNRIEPDDWQALGPQIFTNIFAGQRDRYEYRFHRKDGRVIWISQTNNSRWDEAQQCWVVTAFSVDISDRKVAEQALRDNEARLKEAQRVAQVGSWELDVTTRDVLWSEQMFQIVGFDPDQPMPSFEEILARIPDPDREQLLEALERAIADGIPYDVEHRVCHPDGSIRYIVSKGQTVLNQQQQVVSLYGTALDVTNRKQVELALQQYERIVDVTVDAIALVDCHYHYQIINPTYLEWHKKSYADIIGNSISELLGQPTFETIVKPYFDRCLAGEAIYFNEWFELDGLGRRFLNVTYLPYRDTNQTISGVLVSARDITDIKQAEEALRRSEERFREIAETISQLFLVRSATTGEFLYISPAYEKIWGYSCESLYQNPDSWMDHIHPSDRDRVLNSLQDQFAGQPVRREYRIIRADGAVRWIAAEILVVRDDAGQSLRFIGAAEDITDRKQSELALQHALQDIETHFQESPLAIMQWDDSFRVLRWSKQAERLFGWRSDEVNTLAWKEFKFVHEDDVAQVSRVVHNLLSGAANNQVNINRNYTKDGQVVLCQWYSSAVFDAAGNLVSVLSFAEDITERHRAELALAESEARLSAILQAIPDLMALISAEGVYLDVRCAGKELHNVIDDPQPVGKRVADVLPPDIAQRQLAAIDRVMATGEPQIYEQEVLVRGKVQFEEVRAVACGEQAVLVIVRDISDRHRSDRIKDEFISIVSHELRTPLTSIRGSLGILATGVLDSEPDTAKHMLHVAVNNCDRLVRLVNDILDLERLESGKVQLEMQACPVDELLQQAVQSVQAIALQADITIQISSLDAAVWAAPDAIVQTLVNLLSNAIKFSPAHSSVWLSAQRVDQFEGEYMDTSDRPSLHSPVPPSPHVLFSVKDQGRGVPADKLDTIFGRFQQVDASDSRQKGGTGLGLAICKSIVQQHSGTIWLESVVNQGTIFYFTLPLSQLAVSLTS